MKSRLLFLSFLLYSMACLPAAATTFYMDKVSDAVVPSTRSAANTTWFGWELFDSSGTPAVLNDSTPDIGTTTTGVNFQTTNGNAHFLANPGNVYTGSDVLAEQVTVVTNGTTNSGFTTIIAQFLTSRGDYLGPITVGAIDGNAPTVVQGVNNAGKGQVWAKWQIPGNKASYTFTLSSVSPVTNVNIDRLVVDTTWSATAYIADSMIAVTPPVALTIDQASGLATPSSRGAANTTSFGWKTFSDASSTFSGVINDSTPDLGNTTITGANFQTTNSEVHELSNNGHFYFFAGSLAEQVTVPTSGTLGSAGYTTIIAQITTAFGDFPDKVTLGSINGVSPTLVQGVNAIGSGQVWAKWKIPGNQASYTFTITGPAGVASYSFSQVMVDTVFSTTGYQADTAVVTTPALAGIMDQVAAFVTPSTRGNLNTTYFGWETFSDANGTYTGVINDSTPDLGNTAITGANFQTTNGENHDPYQIKNIYFDAGTLAEQVTVPTSGTVGATGFTTIIAQIESAQGPGAGMSAFAGPITMGSITPTGGTAVSPTVVQSVNSAGIGQLWAKWQIPGNQASYTFTITGPTGQAHYSIDHMVVDTVYSATAAQGDTMIASALAVTTATLPVGATGRSYGPVSLAASAGTSPYTWALANGSTLPTGITLATDGTLSGTPTATASSSVAFVVTDSLQNTAQASLTLTVTTPPSITSTSPLAGGLTGAAYSAQFAATGGTGAYAWSLSSGTLPAGLSLSASGAVSGTPTTAGTSSFTVQVKDDNKLITTKDFSLTVVTLTVATGSPLPAPVKAVAYTQILSATGGTAPYVWTVSAGTLPAGLALSSAGVLSGKPTTAGTSSFTVQVSDHASFSATKVFSLTVYATYQVPVLSVPDLGPVSVGVPFSYALSATNYPKSYTVTGLPHGMGCNAATGLITGRSTIPGVFNVKIKATNSAGSSPTLAAILIVKALPNTFLGSFTGLVSRDQAANNNLGALLTLTTSNTGAFTLKVTTGVTAKTTTGYVSPTAPNITATIGSQALALTIDSATGLVSGSLGSATVTGWQNVWNNAANPAVTLAGYYSIGLDLVDVNSDGQTAIPQGSGYATFTIKTDGTLAIAGKTADGQAITSAGFVGPTGQIVLHSPLYTNLGSITGRLTLAVDANGWFMDNTVSGSLTWLKPVTTGHTYAAGFGSLTISAYGKYLAAAATGYEVLGLPEAGTANLVFTDGGLSAAAMDPDVTGFTYTEANKVVIPTAGNPAKTTLAINKTTGAITGAFTLVDTAPALTRKVIFQGQIVRPGSGSSIATGWFVLPQKPATGQTNATAPILSGKVTIQQQQP